MQKKNDALKCTTNRKKVNLSLQEIIWVVQKREENKKKSLAKLGLVNTFGMQHCQKKKKFRNPLGSRFVTFSWPKKWESIGFWGHIRVSSFENSFIQLRNKFYILFSEMLHVPDLWIFRALKIRPQSRDSNKF